MKQKLSRAQLIAHYRQKPLEQMPESFKALCQYYPQAFKALSQNPYQARPIRGFNQEILVYSSNCATPLKTAGVYQSGGEIYFVSMNNKSSLLNQNNRILLIGASSNLFSRSTPGQANHLLSKIWYYVDDYLKVQGPFSSIQMDNWYLKGYFDDILRIGFKPENSEGFLRIYQLKTQKQSKRFQSFQEEDLVRLLQLPHKKQPSNQNRQPNNNSNNNSNNKNKIYNNRLKCKIQTMLLLQEYLLQEKVNCKVSIQFKINKFQVIFII